MNYWDNKEKLFKYIDGVRQYFPDTIARILNKFDPPVRNFLDLGCGDGFLGHFLYRLYPDAHGVFLDFSNEMINKAKRKDAGHSSEFIVGDFGQPQWFKSINTVKKFDLVVSGFSIHHIENDKKKILYEHIYDLLNPDGVFLNLEHVSSSTHVVEEMFNDMFLDGMSEYQKSIGDIKTREEVESIYYDPDHKKMNILESVEAQCNWLRDIGFSNVDCYLKIFELALFGGTK